MKYKQLTKSEEEVMKLLWKKDEPATVSQLISQLPLPHPPHSTISSIIRILEKKGFVDHKSYGRTHVYFTLVKMKDYTRFSLSRIVRNYFDGSMNELVSFLVKENDLSLDDLTELIDKFENE